MTPQIHSNARQAVEARRAQWAARVEAEMDRQIAILRGCPDVRRVIVFGSAARGAVRCRSDLDLLVVQETALRYVDRLEALYRLLRPKVPTDLVVYTPAEWAEMKSQEPFARRIQAEGRVLHAVHP